jgi:hypothetical protein
LREGSTPLLGKVEQNRLREGSTPLLGKVDLLIGSTFSKVDAVFTVKPELQNDIYNLYTDGDKFHNVALVPDFKTSVLLNKLFRNIKENENLDALEESDDETEFEDDRDDRFVFLDKAFMMVCAYNHKFNKWSPVRLADASAKLVSQQELVVLEQQYKKKKKY